MLRNEEGEILIMFPKQVGVRDSNEVKVLTILEADLFHKRLMIET